MSAFPALAVAVPLIGAALLLILAHALPRHAPDILAILLALAVAGIGAALFRAPHPVTLWFGGWTPLPHQVIGVAFVADPPGALIVCFAGILFAAVCVFAWGFFDAVHAHFHILALLFLAGVAGFCLTHDLFNLFVWFEVMSVSAFALTGYELRTSALEGALNFTITNTVGAYLILSGIGLAYVKTGALDFAGVSQGIAAAPDNPVLVASFVLIATGLLIKAAQFPFHLWLPDAHTVAPSPVSVIFSGIMVSLGLFGLARTMFAVFAPSPAIGHLAQVFLLPMGGISAVLGGVMCLLQRHLKRLLAFSTISHAGIMLMALAVPAGAGAPGFLAYFVAHGATKGALFMISGLLLATRASIDELELRGLGRGLWPAGVCFAFGALLLAGLPVGLFGLGGDAIHAVLRHTPLAFAAALAGEALTGGAVLRATGRVFLGLGPDLGDAASAPTERDQEKADRPVAVMLAPAVLLLVLALVAPPAAERGLGRAAGALVHPDQHAVLTLATTAAPAPIAPGKESPWVGVSGAAAAALIAAGASFGHRTGPLARFGTRLVDPISATLEAFQSGRVGDYLAWLSAGLAVFAAAAAFVSLQ